jgi:hypothetical protein
MKPFLSKSQIFGLGQTIWTNKNFGAFGVFSVDSSALILVLPCPCFSLTNHYFYKKLSFCIQIPNIYLGIGFVFGPQRISLGVSLVCQNI